MNDQIVEALRRASPSSAATGTAFVERRTASGERWPITDRVHVLLAAGQQFRMLMHGCVGVGKTSELAQMAVTLSPRWTVRILQADPTNLRDVTRQLTNSAGGDLFLIDGLDRSSDLEARALIAPGTALLRARLPAFVLVLPQTIMTLSRAERDDGFDDVVHLPPFPVFQEDCSINEAALEHFTRGLERRFEGLDVFDSPAILRRAAIGSGGVPRDAIRILRGALIAGASSERVHEGHLMSGEREVRHDLTQALRRGDESRLDETMQSHLYRDDPRLIASGTVLLYEGASRYWLPHPLLWHLAHPSRRPDPEAILNA